MTHVHWQNHVGSSSLAVRGARGPLRRSLVTGGHQDGLAAWPARPTPSRTCWKMCNLPEIKAVTSGPVTSGLSLLPSSPIHPIFEVP